MAADFFTVEVWTPNGLQRFVVLFCLDLSTRQVEIAGMSSLANGLWMGQIGRKVTDAVDGILLRKRYLIHDRDPLFTSEFLNLLAGVGVKSVKLPPRSPNLNAHAERFVRSIKESCLVPSYSVRRRILADRCFPNSSLIITGSARIKVSATDFSAPNQVMWETAVRSSGKSV